MARLANVHEHGRTLPLVAVGDNRIGKVEWSRKNRFATAPGGLSRKRSPTDRENRRSGASPRVFLRYIAGIAD